MKRKKKGMRFDFLDLVQIRNQGHRKSHRGVVLQGIKSVHDEIYHIQWPKDVTVIHADLLERYGS